MTIEVAMEPSVWGGMPADISQWLVLDTIHEACAAITRLQQVDEVWSQEDWTDIRRYLSRASMVCRSWAERLRPLLLWSVSLSTEDDVHTFRQFLSSPLSSMSLYIVELRFNLELRRHNEVGHVLRLLPILPMLQHLRLGPLTGPIKAFEAKKALHYSLLLRPCPTNMRTLKTLWLDTPLYYASFSSFLRDLAALPSLQTLILSCNVSIGTAFNVSDFSACRTFFPSLLEVKLVPVSYRVRNVALFAWIFGAAILQISFEPRRVREPRSYTDLSAIMDIMRCIDEDLFQDVSKIERMGCEREGSWFQARFRNTSPTGSLGAISFRAAHMAKVEMHEEVKHDRWFISCVAIGLRTISAIRLTQWGALSHLLSSFQDPILLHIVYYEPAANESVIARTSTYLDSYFGSLMDWRLHHHSTPLDRQHPNKRVDHLKDFCLNMPQQ